MVGSSALLQCNMTYMRCSNYDVKVKMLRRTKTFFDKGEVPKRGDLRYGKNLLTVRKRRQNKMKSAF